MTYREKIEKMHEGCPGMVFQGAPNKNVENSGCHWKNYGDCEKCWNIDDEKTKVFQEDMMAVLGDMTKAQAKFAIEWLWNKYFKEEK